MGGQPKDKIFKIIIMINILLALLPRDRLIMIIMFWYLSLIIVLNIIDTVDTSQRWRSSDSRAPARAGRCESGKREGRAPSSFAPIQLLDAGTLFCLLCP